VEDLKIEKSSPQIFVTIISESPYPDIEGIFTLLTASTDLLYPGSPVNLARLLVIVCFWCVRFFSLLLR
jgi:hypothetical protein